ncbi:MAG: hypothetical protein CSA38_05460 [Flavobacteriales bacterium]|nr:MAG: hypothetical protein CSA38_05460 [Flavobacteriales bacterium]
MDWHIGEYQYFGLVIVLPILGFALLHYLKWLKARRTIFAEERFQETLFEKQSVFSKVFTVLYFLAILFLIFAFVDVLRGGEKIKVKQKMNQVIFLLDVSNSMNAEDIKPNRLVEAKNIMIHTMFKMQNDRVGVVVFAGNAVSIMPLTTDYNAIETYLNGIETSIIKNQGTDFLEAMKIAVQKFKNVGKGSRKVILISDGEDNEGNDEKAIDLAQNEGIEITSVGVGTLEGAPIPQYVYGQFMGYKSDRSGEVVITKKQTNALKDLAQKTGGTFINATDLEPTTNQIINNLARGGSSSEIMIDAKNSEHYYQYFLGVALLLFFVIYFFNPKKDLNI